MDPRMDPRMDQQERDDEEKVDKADLLRRSDRGEALAQSSSEI